MAIEARRYVRVKLKAFAAVGATGKADIYREYNATCINISEGGCCLQLATMLSGVDIDFGIKVGIDLPDGEPRLVTAGRVVWLKELGTDVVERYSVGIEFQHIKPPEKGRLKEFVQSRLESKQ